MATKIIKAQITQRHDTRSNWESVNPVLLEGEMGLVSDDPNLYKVGDGRTEWNNLPYRGFDGTLVQEEGTSANAAMSQKAVTEALAKKPDTTGTYPSMRVGTADDLAGHGESAPAEFTFRATGGKSIKDGRAYIKRIKGNSVVWNQKYKPASNAIGTQTINGVTFTISEDGTVEVEGTAEGGSAFVSLFEYKTFIASHKYLLIAYGAPAGEWNKQGLYFVGITGLNDASMIKSAGYKIFQPSADGASRLTLTAWDGYSLSCRIRPIFIDLTQMFGAGNEPSTIEKFNARVATLGVDMNAYNEGQVIHCNTESIKSVGDNAWDEEVELGSIDANNGALQNNSTRLRSKNYTRVLPNQDYYFLGSYGYGIAMFDENKVSQGALYVNNGIKTIPNNVHYIKFNFPADYGTTYKNDYMITLVHSGWKIDTDAGYQPYWEDTLPLPVINKYFPQGMKSAGSAHDEIRFNKATQKWEKVQRIGEVDMGDMAWSYDSANQVFTSYTIMDLMTHPAEVSERNKGLLCSKYSPSSAYVASAMDDKSWLRIPKSVTIKDTSYTDATTFKADMAGVMLYYELAEPIVTELDAEDQNFRDYYQVADFGTEMSQSSVPSAPFSADIIYQFNAVDQIRDNAARIAQLEALLTAMQAQITSLTNNPE